MAGAQRCLLVEKDHPVPAPIALRNQRVRSISLLVVVVLCDGATMLLSHSPYNAVGWGLTLVALGATVGAIVSLLLSKGDWPLRGLLLLIIVAYTAYKAYVVVDFQRNG